MRSNPPNSLAPPRTEPERRVNFVGHAIVNGLGVASCALMHLFGSLDPQWALGGVLLICGVWGANTRKGPPPGSAGVIGVLAWLSEWIPRR